MPSRISLILGCSLLGIVFSFLPWVSRLELPLYDYRMEWMQEEDRENIPRHPVIQMIAYDEATARKVADWGASQEAQIGKNLASAGALTVLLMRPGKPVEEAPLLDAQKATGIFMQGIRLLDPSGNPLPGWKSRLAAVREVPAGSVDFTTDPDRIVRKAFLAVQLPERERPLPSAALLLFARIHNVRPENIQYGSSSIRVGSFVLPTAPDYSIYVRVLSPRTVDLQNLTRSVQREYLAPVSAAGLLDRKDPLYGFADGRVFLFGEFLYDASDQVRTTFDRMKNLQFQACVLDTLMGEWFLRPVPGYAQLAVLALFTLLAAFLSGWVRPLKAILVMVGMSVVLFVFSYQLFTRGWLLNVSQPLVSALVASLVLQLHRFLSILRNLRKFGGLSAFEAARSLDESRLTEVGEQEATIVFCNIPEVLKELEKQDSPDYFRRRQAFSVLLNDVAQTHRGTVFDFQGDAPMIGFGTELRRPDPLHAYHAVRAALEIVEISLRLCYLWPDVQDMDQLKVRCGVATGLVAVGQVGAQGSKLAQAAIGDTTNTAARLLGAARKLSVDVLVTQDTQLACASRFEFNPMEPVRLKGKSEPVPVASLDASEQ